MRRAATLLALLALTGLLAGCGSVPTKTQETTSPTSADPTGTAKPGPVTPGLSSPLPLVFECDEDAASACSQPGAVRWSLPLDLPVGVSGTGEHGGVLLFLDPLGVAGDGSTALRKTTFDIVEGVVYFMDGTHLRVIQAGTGVLLSSVDLPTAGMLSPASSVLLGQGRLWWVRTLFADPGSVELVSISPGEREPTVRPLEGGGSVVAIGDDGVVTASSTSIRGLALDGTPRWQTDLPVDGYVQVDDGVAYVGTAGGLSRVDVLTGAQLEEVTFASLGQEPSHLVSAQDGVVTFEAAAKGGGWTLDLATMSTTPAPRRSPEPTLSSSWPAPARAPMGADLASTADSPEPPLSAWDFGGGTAALDGGRFLTGLIGCAEGQAFSPTSHGAPEYMTDCLAPVLYAYNQ